MATIKEIAELAGVSRGTVDRVLNHRGAVNSDTAEKVMDIAKSLEYRPNRAGLVLAAQKRNLKIGAVLFGIEDPFFDDVVKGMQKKAEEFTNYNCSVLIRRAKDGVNAQLKAIDELLEEKVHGITISPYNDDRIARRLKEVTEMGIPVITFHTDIENSGRLAYVGCDYYLSGQTAAGLMHLMTSDVVNCGIITGFYNILSHEERISGFKNRIDCEYHNINIVDIISNENDDDTSYAVTTKLLKEHPEINALFFAAGGVYGGCCAVSDLNLQDSITIITYDKTSTTQTSVNNNVIAATICQNPERQGSLPLDILFSYLTTGELPEKELNYMKVDIRIKENI